MYNIPKLKEHNERNARRKVHSTENLHKEIREIFILITIFLKGLEQKEANIKEE